MPDLIAGIYECSRNYGLMVEQGSYRLLQESPAESLIRYEITLPVKGDYSAIRGFISQVLIELPTLSLDAISLNRANSGDPMIEAELRMTLYLRSQ